MSPKTNHFMQRICLAAAAFGAAMLLAGCDNKPAPKPGAGAPPAKTNVAEPAIKAFRTWQTNSVFDVKLRNARDPFFPGASPNGAEATGGTNAAPAAKVELDLRLYGIIGTAANRMALINHRPFAVGEEARVPVQNGEKVTVKCLEIREESVVISIKGREASERKELYLSR